MNEELNSNQRDKDSNSEAQNISEASQHSSGKKFQTPPDHVSEVEEEEKAPVQKQTVLSQQTQQTIMEIIHALKSYTGPDNSDLLFKTLVETS